MVRDGRLVGHQQRFPTLGTSLPCVGSYRKAPDEASGHWSARDGADAELDTRLFVSRPQTTTSR
jgi:hypothetical protein